MIGTNSYTTWVKWLEQNPNAETKIIVSPIQTLFCIDAEIPPRTEKNKTLSYWCERLDMYLSNEAKEKLFDYGAVIILGKPHYYLSNEKNTSTIPCTGNGVIDCQKITNCLFNLFSNEK